MKKLILASLGLIAISGCSHAYIANAGSDNVEACCPTSKVACGESALESLAKDHCGGDVSRIGERTVNSGGYDIHRNYFGNTAGEINSITPTYEKCMLFKCDVREPASSSK